MKKIILLDPQLLKKVNVNINTSTSKQMYTFSKSIRFPLTKISDAQFFYDLPTQLNRRSTSIGYGTKTDFTKNANKGKADRYYEIPREFELFRRYYPSPKYSFGQGREICKTLVDLRKTNFPGPGAYNPHKRFGSDALKFSVFGRTWSNKKFITLSTPGPGQYKYLNINTEGRYPSSDFTNVPFGKFYSTSKRFNYRYNKNPSPNAYYKDNLVMFNGTGIQFNNKYESNLGKTITSRPKEFIKPKDSGTPGPGSYEIFSDFNGFSKMRKENRKRRVNIKQRRMRIKGEKIKCNRKVRIMG